MPIDKDNPLKEPVWERQKYETELAFGAFRIYRDLPYGAEDPILTDADDNPLHLEPEPRTHNRVAELLDRSKGHISNWASDWKWSERALAYDKRMERLELEERKRARMEAARRMEQRAILYRDDAAELYTELVDKVRRMLAFPVAEEKIVEGPDGEERVILAPAKWNMNTLARLVSSIEDLARFAAGTDNAGMMDRLLERIDPASLTNDQRRRIINGESISEVLFSGSGIPVPNEGIGTGTRTKQDQISEVI